MELNKKITCAVLLIAFFIFAVMYNIFSSNDEQTVINVISPVDFIINNNDKFKLKDIKTFSPDYTDNNKELAKILNLTEDEAFIFGNFGKYWAKNLLEGRKVKIKDDDLVYYKFGYRTRLTNSPYAIINGKPANEQAFNRQLAAIRRGKFVLLDIDTDMSYPVSKYYREKLKNFVVVRKSHVRTINLKTTEQMHIIDSHKLKYVSGNIKIIVSDLTTKIKPDRNCKTEICKEIIGQINNAENTIDIAIYGYSSTPEIEKAVVRAKNRGVKIRLIYDVDEKGNNIYPDTFKFSELIPDNVCDSVSSEARNTMHNKFYIFDKKIVITGSANLSHTDMSGYNSNSIIVIESPEIAKIYTQEFEQMYSGVFHNSKRAGIHKDTKSIKVFFSPQDKTISNGILPLIQNAKKYIYIPSFVITEKRITNELVKAKQRGVDVRLILDALNASTQHSKHKELRSAGVLVKAENYAGKMHSKTMIIDDEHLVIGSMNFSKSGENRNDENVIIISDSGAAKFYKEFFIYQWNKIPDKWLKYTPRAEGKDSLGSCSDGIDNNYDGKTDMEDDACKK